MEKYRNVLPHDRETVISRKGAQVRVNSEKS
jgi:hypothetical protein